LIDDFLASSDPKVIRKVLTKIDLRYCPNCNKLNPKVNHIRTQLKGEIGSAKLKVMLKKIRKAKKLTQKDISNFLGFSVARYSAIENNKKKPSILLALKIAHILDCDVNEIFELEFDDQYFEEVR